MSFTDRPYTESYAVRVVTTVATPQATTREMATT